MRLIDTADGKCAGDPFMTALHGSGILCIKRASLLIDHDPVRLQGIITIPVKFPGEQSLRRTKRIGRIHNDQIVFRLTASDKFQCVFKMNLYSAVIHPAGIARQIRTARFHYQRIHLYKIDFFHTVIAGQLPHYATVSGTDHQNIFRVFMDCHGHMGDHFVIDKFIPFRQHDVAIQRKNPSEFRSLKNVDPLIITLSGIQMFLHTKTVFYIGSMKLRKPHFHFYLHSCARSLRISSLCQVRADTNLVIEKFYFSIFALPFYSASTFRCRISGSSGPVMLHPLAFAYSI